MGFVVAASIYDEKSKGQSCASIQSGCVLGSGSVLSRGPSAVVIIPILQLLHSFCSLCNVPWALGGS